MEQSNTFIYLFILGELERRLPAKRAEPKEKQKRTCPSNWSYERKSQLCHPEDVELEEVHGSLILVFGKEWPLL